MRKSSYSFIPILLKLYRCCDHALKIYAWNLDVILRLIFVTFFVSRFSGIFTMKMDGQWLPCVRNSSYNFMPIHLKLYMCYGHGLKICMWFGCNPWIISSPEPSGSQGELIVYPCSVVRPSVRRPSSTIFKDLLL